MIISSSFLLAITVVRRLKCETDFDANKNQHLTEEQASDGIMLIGLELTWYIMCPMASLVLGKPDYHEQPKPQPLS
jgi:hypothetical protein